MEKKEQQPPGGQPQAAEGEDNQLSEEKRAIVALARILGSGPLDGRSLRLLEQLATASSTHKRKCCKKRSPPSRQPRS